MERKGVEPSTSALRTQETQNLSDVDERLAATGSVACTNACTSESESASADMSVMLNPTAHDLTHADQDLIKVIDLWATLPPVIKAGIVAMIDAAGR